MNRMALMRKSLFLFLIFIVPLFSSDQMESELRNERIQKLIQSLGEVDGCLIEEPNDLFYLTGLSLSVGKLWVSPSGACLFVDGRYYGKAKKEAPCPVALIDSFKESFQTAKQIAFDSAFITYNGLLALKNDFPHVEWVPVSSPVKSIRLCKSPNEIEALEKAARLTWEGYQRILQILKEGITEAEVALEFEIFCRKNGASGLSFEPIIAFGENSAYPHHRAGNTPLKNNQIVLIDVGAVVDKYRGDMTRVFFFGEPDPQLTRLNEIVQKAQRKAVAHVRPGIRVEELDQIVREEFRRENVEELYTHGLGHGIGLQTHEYPIIKVNGKDKDLILKPGMVFTIEPGLYQPGLGGVRYEDTVLVTETGCENFYPQD